MIIRKFRTQILPIVFLALSILELNAQESCYDHTNKPVRCYPEFINAVFNRPVEVTNTCGDVESEFCVQTNLHGSSSSLDYVDRDSERCDVCDNRRRDKSHPPEYLTDYNSQDNLTWWQSDTMEYNIQYPNSINLTLHLGKSFDITYIQVKFHSPRPESFAIYKKTNESSDWVPYQFYSANCEQIYSKPNREIITRDNEAFALCTDEFSDIAPLSGGSVAFSTLEGRPNAYNFENSDELKEWVTATDIRITLNRLNTFGDELFGDPKVLRSYFYAISDISVGGRCKCNGHADRCVTYQDKDFEEKYKCDCKHNTDGVDCEKCLPFFNDRPWSPATYSEANECVPCNCNGLSDKCFFNATLYDQTGHGGHCYDCQRNTDGVHCENCKFGYYRREYDNECIDCQCHKDGSLSLQCDPAGRCKCKPGVTGDKCDRCLPNHYDLTGDGCKLCNCDPEGSFDSPPVCDQRDGKCRCKQNVEGQNCEKCKPGFFGKDGNLTSGCLQCFCYGHSSNCNGSKNHVSVLLESSSRFNNLIDWTSTDANGNNVFVGQDDSNDGIFVNTQDKEVWFNAPSQFLGQQRNTYNQELSLKLKFQVGKSTLSKKDLIIENSNNNLQIYRTLYDQANNLRIKNDPLDTVEQEFIFKLKETDGWRPTLSSKDFQRLLSNITSIKIKANVDYTFLQSFSIKSAEKVSKNSGADFTPAKWIEECTCPPSHTGQFCENCAPGFRREIQFGDSFIKCVPCSCNNHSLSCDSSSGKCNCLHQTTGENCESCKEGYYGNALQGTPNDCRKCPCPNDGPCAEFYNYQSGTNEVVCLKCPAGTKGNLCDLCDDGHYEVERTASKLVCEKCKCNSNIDENAVGNCDTTGKCLRCIYNTTGNQCESCLPSYWGNALSDIKCHACECNSKGSNNNSCNLDNGQCNCKPNVIGRQCDKCKDTFWNLDSGEGCQECRCNPLGSIDLNCDEKTGRCECRPGVQGLKCDECMPNYFGFSSDGCKKCDCDPNGSLDMQCNELGQCLCKENIAGLKCNQCKENFYNFTMGCKRCDDCYNLVQDAVNNLRKNISLLENSLNKIIPESMSQDASDKNQELQEKLELVKNKVDDLHDSYFRKNLFNSSYKETVKMLEETTQNLTSELKKLQKPYDSFEKKLMELNSLKDKLKKVQDNVELQLTLNSISLQQLETEDIIEKKKEQFEKDKQDEKIVKLSEIARSTRDKANEQEKLAKGLSSSVHTFLQGSTKAISDIQDLLNKFELIKTQPDTDYDFLAKTSNLLAKESQDVRIQLDKEIENLNKLNSKLNSFALKNNYDNDVLTEENYKFFSESIGKLKEESEKLNKKLSEFSETAQSDLEKAKDAVKQATLKDKDMQKLLERSEKAKTKVDEAFNATSQSFKDAQKILDTLENFETVFKLNKERADKAENLKPEIESNIQESRTLSDKLESAIENNKKVLSESKSLIEGVDNNVEKSSKELELLKSKSSDLNNKTIILSNFVNDLTADHQDKSESIESTLSKYNELSDKLVKVQNKAEKIVDKSQSLLNRISNSEDDLASLKDLDLTLKDLSIDAINRLNFKFDQVVSELDLLNELDDQIADLQRRYERSNEELKIYEREIPLLKQNVLDLDRIQKSMCS
ncbi:unnamed protein product [Brachionus calyciflorus]|uniref:Laminin subunit gamma-1 n=1 Tax=Brachionus calyciflorus TaxID=104777 RepID=A0A813M3Q0_9BILA|nr:unnamed protein product [Brachionus calyciflorus]